MRDSVSIMAVLPEVSARARRFAGQLSVRRAAGLAGYAATSADKARLTANALDLFNRSTTNPTDPALRASIQGAFDELSAFDPWTDTSWWSSYKDSQTVRQNLQQALQNVMVATGQTEITVDAAGGTQAGSQVSQSWQTYTQPADNPSLLDLTLQNVPGAVGDAANCAAQGMKLDPVTGQCVPIISIDATATIKKILIGAVALLVVVGAGYVAISGYSKGRGFRANPYRGRARRIRSSPGRARPGPSNRNRRRAA